MTSKFLATAAFALALVPAVANAGEVAHDTSSIADYGSKAADGVVTFLTKVIVPDDNGQPPIAYADNPELIGTRRGSTNPAWIK